MFWNISLQCAYSIFKTLDHIIIIYSFFISYIPFSHNIWWTFSHIFFSIFFLPQFYCWHSISSYSCSILFLNLYCWTVKFKIFVPLFVISALLDNICQHLQLFLLEKSSEPCIITYSVLGSEKVGRFTTHLQNQSSWGTDLGILRYLGSYQEEEFLFPLDLWQHSLCPTLRDTCFCLVQGFLSSALLTVWAR